MQKLELPPNPSSLVESMRDIGYSIETAIADIIDNSITALAKSVSIRFSWNKGNPWLAIIDDGHGMNSEELIKAMRLGSMSPLENRNLADLGRFGLGLKTASFSQCRCLTVVSKKGNILNCAQWDLDTLTSRSQWSLNLLSANEIRKNSEIFAIQKEYLDTISSGTIVLWQKFDRIDEGSSRKSQEDIFNETIYTVKSHLELVFHRFISPDPGKSRIALFFNESRLEAFDPFNILKATELRSEEFLFEKERIYVQPYVLPHHNKVSKSEWKKYAGENGYLHEQGFYVYRNRRLIIYGTWFRLIPKKELSKLLRVKIDIPNSLDHLWRIDVKKSNAFPPTEIREELKRIIQKIEFAGKRVYKQRGQKLTTEAKVAGWKRIAKENQIFYQINEEHPLIKKHISNLNDSSRKLFINIVAMLESSFPRDAFFNDISSNPEDMNSGELEKEKIEAFLEYFIGDMDETPNKKLLLEVLHTDPFASNKVLTKAVFRERNYDF